MLVLECVLVCGCLALLWGISLPHLIFDMGFSLKLDVSGWLGGLASEVQGSSCPCLPCAGMIVTTPSVCSENQTQDFIQTWTALY